MSSFYKHIDRLMSDVSGEHITFGESVLGRPLNAVVIGKPRNPIVYTAAYHGCEWITALVLARFARRAVTDEGLKFKLSERGIVVAPLINPDGVEIAQHGVIAAGKRRALVGRIKRAEKRFFKVSRIWQANANGVDLNHNFDAGWNGLHEREVAAGIVGPASTRYGGTVPFSQPETIAVKKLCERFQPSAFYAFHSQGEEIYYSYGDNTPKESRIMAEMLAAKCRYSVCAPEGLAVGGGAKDWFIEKYARPGFTFEVGRGANPLPLGDLPAIFAKLWDALYLSVML
jgi:Predicted carboxypeptidase